MEALKGIKIVEFAWFAVGPYISQYLAQHGATVVKVESSAHPDSYRLDEPFTDGKVGLNRGANFALSNACKYGITLNLALPKGRKLALKLIRWADVVVQAFPPGSFKRLKLDYESVKEHHPQIIYFNTCLQGQTGPHAQLPGLGPHLSSLSGFTALAGWPDRDPVGLYGAYTDFVAYQFGVIAIMAALDYRRRTGKGQHIDQSQYESSLQFQSPLILDYSANGRIRKANGSRHPWASPHGVFPCRGEERWVAITIFSDEEWHNFCRVTGGQAWENDERFATLLARKKNEATLEEMIASWTKTRTPEEVMEMLQTEGVCAGVVETGADLHADPQLEYRHHFWTHEHPEMGKTDLYESTPFRLSRTPGRISGPAPCLGEHNSHVYTEILGLSDDEFVSLLEEGVID
jgi:benzylsuccinate CoA-transferase BbsF subunit